MNVPSLLLRPDRSTCHLELNSLSDQARMELLFDSLDSASSEEFKDSTGAYKDVCKWGCIVCNGRRRVTRVELYNHISGSLNLSYLPELTEVFNPLYEKSVAQPVYGTLDMRTLPPCLFILNLAYYKLQGSVDFRRLPSALQYLGVEFNDFSGSMHLISLPKELQNLLLEGNEFCGSIQLNSLPQTLRCINLADNVLSGSLNLRNLPNALEFLSLSDNCFTGSISLDRLPRKLEFLTLDGNNLSGQFALTNPPEVLQDISACGNLFAGTAFISQRAMPLVNLRDNLVEMVIDEFGQKTKLRYE